MHPKFGGDDVKSFDSNGDNLTSDNTDNCHFKIDCESEEQRVSEAGSTIS